MSNTLEMSYVFSNTEIGNTNHRGEWIPATAKEGRKLYSKKIKVKVLNPSEDYSFPDSIESSRISEMIADKERDGEPFQAKLCLYTLDTKSVKEFEATEDMPATTVATYRPTFKRNRGGF